MAYQPKSYKKFVATAATATLVASAIVPVAFANDASTAAFTDVKESYADAVSYLVENNFAVGKTDTTFGISEEITRGDAAIIIAKAAGLMDEKAAASGFTDVPNRGAIAVNSLKAAGVINGTSATKFGWDQPIKRGDVAIMFAKAFELTGDTANLKFTDVKEKYENAVAALVDNKVTNGVSTTQFGTDMNIKRGDFAKFVYALKDKITVPAPGVDSVTASNGFVTATFKIAPETTPVATDFVVTRSINGGTATTVTPTNLAYNETTKAVTFNVPEVQTTTGAQTVTYSVKYKDTDAKAGSFTIAAAAVPTLTATASELTDKIVLVFNQPIDAARAAITANYVFDANTNDITNPTVSPVSVTTTTETVGPYAGNQIVTLTFAANTVIDNATSSLTIQNMRTVTGVNIPTATVPVEQVGTFGSAPTVAATLTNGAQTGTTISANAGNTVTLDVTGEANQQDVDVASLRYQIQKPDGTLTNWVSLNAVDGSFDESLETATASINTTGFAGGAYKVITEVSDRAGQVTENKTVTLNIVASDIKAPSITAQTAEFNTTASGTTAARTVTVDGTVADELSNVTNVQYRVQSYNADTNTFANAEWVNATAADGTFNERNEEFSFTTPQLSNSSDYRVQVRTVDAAGNTSNPTLIENPAPSTPLVVGGTTIGFTTPAASAGDVIDPTVTGLTALIAGESTTGETITNQRTVRFTGTANDVPAGTIANVQYGVFRDVDGNGSYETETQGFSSVGVNAVDGSFNTATEAFTIDYTLPATNGDYRVLVRTTDNSGNVSDSVAHDITLDTVVPTATIVPNTSTPIATDFIVTYSENVFVGSINGTDGTPGPSARDFDNYTVRQAGQLIANPVTSVVQNTATNDRQFVVNFTNAPTAQQTINVTSVEDEAGNAIVPTSAPVAQ